VGASWFPDGRSLLVSSIGGGNFGRTFSLIRFDIEEGSRQTLYSAGSGLVNPSVSPDGKRIAYESGNPQFDVVEIGLADGAVHTLIGNGGINFMPDWAPAGTHFLFASGLYGAAAIVDQEAFDGGFSRRLVDTGNDLHPRWSPDGARFVFMDQAAVCKLMLANASGGHASPLDQARGMSGFAWSPDGQWIAYLREDQGESKLLKIRATPGARPVMLADAGGLDFLWVTTQWSPAGDWILYPGAAGLNLISPDGKSRRTLTSRPFSTYSFSRDGSQVYGIFHNTGAGPEWQLYSVNVKTMAEKLVSAVYFPSDPTMLTGFSIHPDGKRALTSIARTPFQLWMLEGFDQPPKNWFERLTRR